MKLFVWIQVEQLDLCRVALAMGQVEIEADLGVLMALDLGPVVQQRIATVLAQADKCLADRAARQEEGGVS